MCVSLKKSGITRRIDELGRIVVPKEIRYNLGIRDGEPLEIYTEDNMVIIKKYSQVENIKELSMTICNIISDVCGVDVLISDREKIIATSSKLNNILNTTLDKTLKKLIDDRESFISKNKDSFLGINSYFTIIPIITSLDSSGLIIISSDDANSENLKYAKIALKFILNKIDI